MQKYKTLKICFLPLYWLKQHPIEKTYLTFNTTFQKIRKVQKKNYIRYFHRLYVPITTDGKNYRVIRLVAEEKNGEIKVNPKKLICMTLYYEEKSAATVQSPSQIGRNHARSGTLTMSVGEMLTNVNDDASIPYNQQHLGKITLSTRARVIMPVLLSGRMLIRLRLYIFDWFTQNLGLCA